MWAQSLRKFLVERGKLVAAMFSAAHIGTTGRRPPSESEETLLAFVRSDSVKPATRFPTRDNDELVMGMVDGALACPQHERKIFLQRACAADSELFAQAWQYVEAEERMKDFLLEPICPLAPSEQLFAPGQLIEERFRITRQIAQGGMGIVYEAVDEKLERRIALKCAKLGFRQRLPPEVRNAREISHPNVCKIFEIHTTLTQHGKLDFLTMEFLDGPTLTDRLRAAPLSRFEARTIAQQLCAGLAEAHRNRVIHGDLKSNNIILTTAVDGSSRAVITDFGLARNQDAAQRTIQSGAIGGTYNYMAPELKEGRKSSVASDIYALGVILYELKSRCLPGHDEPLTNEAPTDEALSPKHALLSRWDRVVRRCLSKAPEHRYRDVASVTRALFPPRTQRWSLVAAVAIALVLVAAGLVYRRLTAPTETIRLVVLPPESSMQGPLPGNVVQQLTAKVSHLRAKRRTSFGVVPLADVTRSHPVSASQAQQLFGATHVLRTTFANEGNQWKVSAALIDAGKHVNVREWSAKYGASEEHYISSAVTSVVTDALHLPPENAPLGNESARSSYRKGLEFLRRDSTIPNSLAAFDEVIRADPDSALGYAGLAEAQWFKKFLTSQQSWLDRAVEAASEAERRNFDFPQIHRVRGLLLTENGLYEQAAAEYKRAIELDPNDAENYRRLGQAYERSSQMDLSLVALQNAVSLQPSYYRAYVDLAAYHYNRADYAQALPLLKQAANFAPDEPRARFALGNVYFCLGSYAEAEQHLRRAVALGNDSRSLHSLGLTLLYQARELEAIDSFSRALRLNADNELSWMYLGIAYRRTNQLSRAADANRRGRDVVEKELARNPRDPLARSVLGYFDAALGDRNRAKSDIQQAMHLASDDAEMRWTAVLTYELLGERKETLRVLQDLRPSSSWTSPAGPIWRTCRKILAFSI